MGVTVALLVAVLGIVPQRTAHAATIVVDTTDDEDNSDGDCSLREALYAANNDVARDACIAGSGDDVIDLTGVAGTITLGGTELAISSNLTIAGPGANRLTISGDNASRVFNVADSVVVIISDVTIANGNGPLDDGGGIYNAGTLTINRCTVASNRTTGNGGGISSSGVVTVNSSTFHNNEADLNGGGVANYEGTLVVNSSTFSGNRASEGTFDNYGGGGILNMAELGSAELTINNCTITANSAMWGTSMAR